MMLRKNWFKNLVKRWHVILSWLICEFIAAYIEYYISIFAFMFKVNFLYIRLGSNKIFYTANKSLLVKKTWNTLLYFLE